MKTRILIIVLVSIFFSLKPAPQKTWVDSSTKALKKGVCGEWVYFGKNIDLVDQLLNREQTAKEFYYLNNANWKTQLTGGYWFFPDNNQSECRKQLIVLDGELVWYPPLLKKLKINSAIGTRMLHRKENIHVGIDLAAANGTRIYSMSSGTVIYSEWHEALGNFIVIETKDKVRILYAHLSRRFVDAGETVQVGQTIGFSGNTGHSTGPHLHIEMRSGNAYVNALSVLKL
jgi:murein DD-endopeptidase MepM/ murein hydrolase activator NlpD